MKKAMKWVFGTAAALVLCALLSSSALAGGSYSFSFGYNSGGRYGRGYPSYRGYYPRASYAVSYYCASPVYYSPPPVVYRPAYYAPAPVYYYSGGSFYCY
jgi:hypothetical protein